MKTTELQGAVVVSSVIGGEVLAVVGGRDPRFAGFNRAVDARRPVGSLLKPAVFLRALADRVITPSTTLDDSPLELPEPDGTTWAPANFDQTFRGDVPALRVLIESLNVPTVRLGLEVGVENVIDTLTDLGLASDVAPYPSLLLGAADMAPVEVAQIYHTLAAGGLRSKLRSVREVLTRDDDRLLRFPLEVDAATDPIATYQVVRLLGAATRHGTARSVRAMLPEELAVAGKTGTTDGFRDSWFAGFSGEYVAVVWVGRDDNEPTGLTGASGALTIWGTLMRDIAAQPFAPLPPAGVEEFVVDLDNGRPVSASCDRGVSLPYHADAPPTGRSRCRGRSADPWWEE